MSPTVLTCHPFAGRIIAIVGPGQTERQRRALFRKRGQRMTPQDRVAAFVEAVRHLDPADVATRERYAEIAASVERAGHLSVDDFASALDAIARVAHRNGFDRFVVVQRHAPLPTVAPRPFARPRGSRRPRGRARRTRTARSRVARAGPSGDEPAPRPRVASARSRGAS